MPPPGAVAAAFARRLLWRLALSGLGGIDVRGKLPRGGCVVVANHTSHADTVALLAALGPRHAPTVGAAADYWFAKRTWRRWLCRSLAAGFPIRRPGGDLDNLLAKAAELRAGRAVVVFPEGTRGNGGPIGEFHSGALQLAQRVGVPVVPVGIAGTHGLLPEHGRLRHAAVRVRIGKPLHGWVTPAHARGAVIGLVRQAAAVQPIRHPR